MTYKYPVTWIVLRFRENKTEFQVSKYCIFPLPVKKSFLSYNKTIWGPLELVEKLYPEAEEIAASVRDLPGLK